MKKIFFGYILAISFLLLHSCRKEDLSTDKSFKPEAQSRKPEQVIGCLYYWSDGKKHPLSVDSTALIFTDPDSSKVISSFKIKNRTASVTRIRSGYF